MSAPLDPIEALEAQCDRLMQTKMPDVILFVPF
jgi:hypothetical protein